MNKKFEIVDPIGLHARPASAIVNVASKFQSKIEIIQNTKSANAKSIINIMSLGVKSGTEIELVTSGPDAKEAFEAIEAILKSEKVIK